MKKLAIQSIILRLARSLLLLFFLSGCTFFQHASFEKPSPATSSIEFQEFGDGIRFSTEEVCRTVLDGCGSYHHILGGPYLLPVLPAFFNPFQWISKIQWYEERQWLTLEFEPRHADLSLDLQKIQLEFSNGEKICPDLYVYGLWYPFPPDGPLKSLTQETEPIPIKYGLNRPVQDNKQEDKKFLQPIVTHIWLGFIKPNETAIPRYLTNAGLKKGENILFFPTIDFIHHSEFRVYSDPPYNSDQTTTDMHKHGLCLIE